MVTVPSQKLQRVAVKPASFEFQSTSVPSGAFDSGASGLVEGGQQLAQAGDELGALALQMQRDDNEAEIREKDVALSEAIRSITYGNPSEGITGYYSTRQKDALDQYGKAEEALNEAIQDVVSSSSNEAVKQSVTSMAVARRQREIDKMTNHAESERISHFNGLNEAREAQAASDAALSWNDPSVLDRSLGIVEGEVADYAERNGLSEGQAEIRLLERQSAVVKSTFDAALANDDIVSAQRILAQSESKIDGITKAEMERQFLEDSRATKAQTLAETAYHKHRGNPTAMREYIRSVASGETEDDALANLEERIAAVRRDYRFEKSLEAEQRSLASAARAELNHRLAMEDRQRKEQLRVARASASEFLYAENATSPRTMRQFRKEHPEQFDILSRNQEVETFQKIEKNIQEGNLFASTTDGETLASIKQMDAADRAEVDVMSLRHKLTRGEYEQAVTSIAAAKRQVQNLQEDRPTYNAARSAIERYMPKRFGPTRTSKKRSESENRIIDAATEHMNTWVSQRLEAGQKPTQPEIDREAARIMMEIEADPSGLSWFGAQDELGAFEGFVVQSNEMSPEQRAVARVPYGSIPSSILSQIDGILGKRGVTDPEEELLEELAGALAMGDSARFKSLVEGAR